MARLDRVVLLGLGLHGGGHRGNSDLAVAMIEARLFPFGVLALLHLLIGSHFQLQSFLGLFPQVPKVARE
jgi:hypothetical protein